MTGREFIMIILVAALVSIGLTLEYIEDETIWQVRCDGRQSIAYNNVRNLKIDASGTRFTAANGVPVRMAPSIECIGIKPSGK